MFSDQISRFPEMMSLRLAVINLSDNYMISSKAWKQLFEGLFFYSASSMREVYLNNCWLDDESVTAITEGIQQGISKAKVDQDLIKMEVIEVADNANITSNGWKTFFTNILLMMLQSLKQVNISNCKLKNEHIVGISKGFTAGINGRSSCCLECLDMSNNIYLSELGYKELFKILFYNAANTYKRILLNNCDLSDEQLVYVLTGINQAIGLREKEQKVTSIIIEEVDLTSNYRLNQKSYVEFFKFLFMNSNKTLKKLSLRKCYLTDAKIQTIVTEIKKALQVKSAQNQVQSSVLQELNIADNEEIGKEGYRNLLTCFMEIAFNNLRVINMSNNCLDTDKASGVMQGLREGFELAIKLSMQQHIRSNPRINFDKIDEENEDKDDNEDSLDRIQKSQELDAEEMQHLKAQYVNEVKLETWDLSNNFELDHDSWEQLLQTIFELSYHSIKHIIVQNCGIKANQKYMRLGILEGLEKYQGDKAEFSGYLETFLADKQRTVEMLEKDNEFDVQKMKRSRDQTDQLNIKLMPHHFFKQTFSEILNTIFDEVRYSSRRQAISVDFNNFEHRTIQLLINFLQYLQFQRGIGHPQYIRLSKLQRVGEVMFFDFDLLLHFQIITKAFFDVKVWPKIYSIVLQEGFYKYILQNQRKIQFTQIVFAKYQKMPYNQMEMLDDDNSLKQLCYAFKKLKGSKINRLLINYEFPDNYHSTLIDLNDEY